MTTQRSKHWGRARRAVELLRGQRRFVLYPLASWLFAASILVLVMVLAIVSEIDGSTVPPLMLVLAMVLALILVLAGIELGGHALAHGVSARSAGGKTTVAEDLRAAWNKWPMILACVALMSVSLLFLLPLWLSCWREGQRQRNAREALEALMVDGMLPLIPALSANQSIGAFRAMAEAAAVAKHDPGAVSFGRRLSFGSDIAILLLALGGTLAGLALSGAGVGWCLLAALLLFVLLLAVKAALTRIYAVLLCDPAGGYVAGEHGSTRDDASVQG